MEFLLRRVKLYLSGKQTLTQICFYLPYLQQVEKRGDLRSEKKTNLSFPVSLSSFCFVVPEALCLSSGESQAAQLELGWNVSRLPASMHQLCFYFPTSKRPLAFAFKDTFLKSSSLGLMNRALLYSCGNVRSFQICISPPWAAENIQNRAGTDKHVANRIIKAHMLLHSCSRSSGHTHAKLVHCKVLKMKWWFIIHRFSFFLSAVFVCCAEDIQGRLGDPTVQFKTCVWTLTLHMQRPATCDSNHSHGWHKTPDRLLQPPRLHCGTLDYMRSLLYGVTHWRRGGVRS